MLAADPMPELGYFVSDRNWKMKGRRLLEDVCFDGADAGVNGFIVHLDDDVVLRPGWLPAALAAARDFGWGAVGSIEDHRGRIVYSGQTRLALRRVAVDATALTVWEWEWQSPPSLSGTVEAEFAGHRALLVEAGLAARARHDPAYLIGGEDLDYSLALRRAGARLGLSHEARIAHRHAGEEDAPQFRTREDVVTSWLHFFRKWRFVRLGAAREAGMEEADWLRLFASAE
jgi:GT2 family glycosyltransferase